MLMTYGYYKGKTEQKDGEISSWKGKYLVVWKKVGCRMEDVPRYLESGSNGISKDLSSFEIWPCCLKHTLYTFGRPSSVSSINFSRYEWPKSESPYSTRTGTSGYMVRFK